MVKKIFYFIVFTLFIANYSYAVKLHTFTDLYVPQQFVMDGKYIYISDPRNPENKIFIYDRADFKLVTSFLKKGEGPQEVILGPKIYVDDQKLYIFAGNKILFYSKKFEYISEMKLSFVESHTSPINGNFIVFSGSRDSKVFNEIYSIYNIQDNQFVKIKDILNLAFDVNDSEKYLVSSGSMMVSWNDKFFIDSREGFYIEVFDANGNKLYTIDKKLKKKKSQEKHREREIEELIVRYGKKLYKEALEQRFGKNPMPKYLPGIKNMYAGENRLYIQTYDTRGNEDEYIIMDFKGNIIETRWLPKSFGSKRYFFDNCFYFFCENDSENEDDRGWDFHEVKLK